jgi:hypothetical protein
MGKNNLKMELYKMTLGGGRLNILDTSPYRLADNSTYGQYGLVSNSYEMLDLFKETNYKSDYEIARDKAAAEGEARMARFSTHGREMSHAAMAKYIPGYGNTERPIKLKDIQFGKPVTALIASRPNVYGVASVHHIAGYKITIKRFADSSDDTVWYDTPMSSYHCTFDKLEETIHEHLLEATQRDLEWDKIK